MENDISLLVGLKNNLKYSQNFYLTTRALYPYVEIIFTSYNSTDGTNLWLESLKDDNIKYYFSKETKTFSDTYNKCIELATKKYVAFVHNDMVLAPGFIENLENVITTEKIIAFTTIEPPVFADDTRPGKIIKDFGSDIITFKINDFYLFANDLNFISKDIVAHNTTTFFICILRQTLLNIKGMDPLFNPMFCEDDDLILRLELLGLKKYWAPNALCYHFVSKTSRFSIEYQNITKQIELNSNRNFVRKWGFANSSQIKKKYDIGIIVDNCTSAVLRKTEPFATTIYIDCEASDYIDTEQANTAIDLREKIKGIDNHIANDIVIRFDGGKLNNKSLQILNHLNEIIYKHVNRKINFINKLLKTRNNNFKKGIFKIEIRNSKTYEHQLIIRN